MKIGFDAHVLDGRDQGTKTLMLRLIDAVARRHPRHQVLVYGERPHAELDFTLPNLQFRPTVRHNVVRYLMHTLPSASRADRLDTMVFNFVQSPLMRNATVMIHDILPQTHSRFFPPKFVAQCWALFGMSALLAKHLFTISEYSKSEIRSVYPWTRGKTISVLHIGASFPKDVYFAGDVGNQPAALPAGTRYILAVGRIEPRKNIQMAIDAFRAGAPDDVKLVIVGRREPGIAIDTHDDPRIMELTGVSDADLITIYRRAALFLYPSVAEGFGLPLLDAILFGLPVIASRRTSMQEVGEGGATFFDPAEADATQWLGNRIAAHFGDDPVAPPSFETRAAKAALYAWDNAADELVAGITGRATR
ncbi:glycosyltransferase family 4 protein [Sphingomonas qomolangmaensis]|uniref:Glycosyltransferase family 4 protein n=1 Tax=Sphingomonas qomolangmaensis TaxID=2918765 RepID=A0ABY5L5X7_9SPHN|nr:glycosyltransferase family 1 protein [Sphingomonas qomolangmaensis]UUL82182.1 glycosyltransferase family 4 protein [Sphingomonas qomolangmaensis]